MVFTILVEITQIAQNEGGAYASAMGPRLVYLFFFLETANLLSHSLKEQDRAATKEQNRLQKF